MRVIAHVSKGHNGKILVEMESSEFEMLCGGDLRGGLIPVGTEAAVAKAFWRVHSINRTSANKIADQLEVLAKQLRPIDGLIREAPCDPDND